MWAGDKVQVAHTVGNPGRKKLVDPFDSHRIQCEYAALEARVMASLEGKDPELSGLVHYLAVRLQRPVVYIEETIE